jgi:hypothetical protein
MTHSDFWWQLDTVIQLLSKFIAPLLIHWSLIFLPLLNFQWCYCVTNCHGIFRFSFIFTRKISSTHVSWKKYYLYDNVKCYVGEKMLCKRIRWETYRELITINLKCRYARSGRRNLVEVCVVSKYSRLIRSSKQLNREQVYNWHKLCYRLALNTFKTFVWNIFRY